MSPGYTRATVSLWDLGRDAERGRADKLGHTPAVPLELYAHVVPGRAELDYAGVASARSGDGRYPLTVR